MSYESDYTWQPLLCRLGLHRWRRTKWLKAACRCERCGLPESERRAREARDEQAKRQWLADGTAR